MEEMSRGTANSSDEAYLWVCIISDERGIICRMEKGGVGVVEECEMLALSNKKKKIRKAQKTPQTVNGDSDPGVWGRPCWRSSKLRPSAERICCSCRHPQQGRNPRTHQPPTVKPNRPRGGVVGGKKQKGTKPHQAKRPYRRFPLSVGSKFAVKRREGGLWSFIQHFIRQSQSIKLRLMLAPLACLAAEPRDLRSLPPTSTPTIPVSPGRLGNPPSAAEELLQA
jgi:hypothetical protein